MNFHKIPFVALMVSILLFLNVPGYSGMLDDDEEVVHGFALGGSLGISDPYTGFDGYSQNPAGAISLKFFKPREDVVKMYYSIALEYFPMALPSDIVDTTEDIYALTLNISMNINRMKEFEFQRFIPFIGFGGGGYWDKIEVNIPNFGSKSSTELFWGYCWDAGLEIRVNSNLSFCPKYRRHYFWATGTNASIATYFADIIFYFGTSYTL